MKKFKLSAFAQLLPYIKKFKFLIISMVIMQITTSLIDSIYPLFNQYALNHFVALKTTDTLVPFILAYLFVLLVFVILNYLSSYFGGKIEMGVNQQLRNASFNHLQTLSFSYFNQNNVGYIHARVMSDTGKIGQLFSWDVMDITWNIAYVIFILINMAIINLHLALYIFAMIPVAIIIVIFFQKKLVVLNRKIREVNSKITSNFNEGIAGAKSIKTLVIEDKINNDFDIDTLSMEKIACKEGRYSALLSSIVTMMGSFMLAIVLWQGGKITQQGVFMIGTLSVFMSYALNLLDPIQNMVTAIAHLISIQVNIERFVTLMNTQSDVADSKEVIAKYGDTFNPKKENWEPLYGDIEFKDVSFKYPDGNEMVLQDFNLHVAKGTNVAIVGETGAGKSTLVNLVCRFFEPTKGQILIDGKDARERSQLWLHSNIGYVLQTPHLFSGTIRDNLKYGNPDATEQQILDALTLVNANFVIDKLDNGLDSQVGEGGDLLSTGEKQLICFARALLADPTILVLDEATASIDTLTEKIIQDAISTIIKGRTSFVIAHRLSTIIDADIILVVKDGKIIESGKHNQLMKQHGYYFDLYTRQYEEIVTNSVLNTI